MAVLFFSKALLLIANRGRVKLFSATCLLKILVNEMNSAYNICCIHGDTPKFCRLMCVHLISLNFVDSTQLN